MSHKQYTFGSDCELDKVLLRLKEKHPEVVTSVAVLNSEYDDEGYPLSGIHFLFFTVEGELIDVHHTFTNSLYHLVKDFCLGEDEDEEYGPRGGWPSRIVFKMDDVKVQVVKVPELPSYHLSAERLNELDVMGEAAYLEIQTTSLNIAQMTVALRKPLVDYIAFLLRKNTPGVISIPIKGHIPYFNDGDPCEGFTLTVETDDRVSIDEGSFENKEDENNYVCEPRTKKYNYDHFKELDSFLGQYQNWMENIFGHYFILVVNRDGTFKVRNWDDFKY